MRPKLTLVSQGVDGPDRAALSAFDVGGTPLRMRPRLSTFIDRRLSLPKWLTIGSRRMPKPEMTCLISQPSGSMHSLHKVAHRQKP